jgi:hypothetical protein
MLSISVRESFSNISISDSMRLNMYSNQYEDIEPMSPEINYRTSNRLSETFDIDSIDSVLSD